MTGAYGYGVGGPGMGGGGGGGALLWEWNGVDTTQFDAGHGFRNDLGGGPLGTPSLDVVASPIGWLTQNVLRVDVPAAPTALAGGFFFRVNDLVGGLPESYVVEWECPSILIATGSTFGPVLFAKIVAGNLNAAFVRRTSSGTNTSVGIIASNQHQGVTAPLDGAAAMTAGSLNRGPDRIRCRVAVRPSGTTPALWQAESQHVFDGGRTGGMSSSSVGVTTQPAAWSGVDQNDFGFAIYNATASVQNTGYFSRFAVYEDDVRIT